MALAWTSDMHTGIDVIDSQHIRIVEYINELENAICLDSHSLVGEVLNNLVDYTLSHFAFEESLQEESGYKLTKPHKAVHDLFVKRVARYQERHADGEDIAKPLHDMLRIWLVNHIKRDDMAYVSEVKTSLYTIVADKQETGWVSRALKRFFG